MLSIKPEERPTWNEILQWGIIENAKELNEYSSEIQFIMTENW